MKDESPRIFRNLEKTAGRDGFDTIVGAAVASYGSLRQPNDTQVRDFGRLVDPLWDKITPETRRSVAAALSHSSRVPRTIVSRLVAEPIEISAPFLMSSPVLEPSDFAALSVSTDSRMQRIVEGRGPGAAPAASPSVPPSAAETAVTATAFLAPGPDHLPLSGKPAAMPSAVDAASPQDQNSLAATPPQALDRPAEPAAEPRPAAATPPRPLLRARSPQRTTADATNTRADLVRETLRRLALVGRSTTPTAEPAPKLQDLVALAVQQDAQRFYIGLQRKLMLPTDMLTRIIGDESGERLAIALKAMNAGAADALTILMMLKPRIGLDVEAFGQMTKYYRALTPEDCASVTGASLRRQTVAAPTLEPQYQDLAPLERAAARPAAGHQASRPGEKDAGVKRA